MKEQNKKLTIAEPIAERLRNGEKVICAKCKAIMLLMRNI